MKIFQLTVLGSGVCIPEAGRNPSGYFLQAGKTGILLDSGSGTLRRLAEAGICLGMIDIIAYTHFHLDHFSDFPAILFSMVNGAKKRRKKLTILGPRGIKKKYLALLEIHGTSMKPRSFPVVFCECTLNDFRLSGIRFQTAPAHHTRESISYRLTFQKKIFVYTGDTPDCEETRAQSMNADLLLIECSMPDGHGVAGHLTPKEVGEIAREGNTRNLMVTHLYPQQNPRVVRSTLCDLFSGTVLFARDLETFLI